MSDINEASSAKMKNTIPLWLAVAITVFLSVPFSLWLGRFNFALWCSFIVWAQYFALGAKPSAIKIIIPSFAYSSIMTAITLYLIQFFKFLPKVVVPGDLAIAVILSAGVAFMVYSMKWAKVFGEGSLPFFNGISMVLAIYFTGSAPKEVVSPELLPLWSGVWAVLMGVFGVILGWFNVWILFPRAEVKK